MPAQRPPPLPLPFPVPEASAFGLRQAGHHPQNALSCCWLPLSFPFHTADAESSALGCESRSEKRPGDPQKPLPCASSSCGQNYLRSSVRPKPPPVTPSLKVKSSPFTLPISLLLLLTTAAPSLASKEDDPKTTPPPPPFPQPLQIQVYRGETTRIPLRARGRLSSEARFLIRSSPSLGTLGPITPAGPGKAWVEYSHKGGANDTSDQFLYAVQSPGTPVSVSSPVIIHITDRPPELHAPQSVNFGEVMPGDVVRKIIPLKNRGGLPLHTKILLEAPWRSELGEDISIPPGSSIDWPILFSPPSPGSYEAVARFSHKPDLLIQLFGSARQTLQVSPSSLEFQRGPDAPPAPPLRIENPSDSPVLIEIQLPPQLQGPNQTQVPPQQTISLEISPSEGFNQASQGNITIKYAHGSIQIPYHIYQAPPLIHAEPSENLRFPQTTPSQTVNASLTLHNRGGQPASLQLSSPRLLFSPSENIRLEPEQSALITLHFSAKEPGTYRNFLLINITGARPLNIPWQAEVLEPSQDQHPTTHGMARTTGLQSGQPPPDNPRPFDWLSPPDAPPPVPWDNLRLMAPNPTSVILEWDAPIQAGQQVTLSQRLWKLDASGQPRVSWAPLENADLFQPSPGTLRLTLYRMQPGTRHYLRYEICSPSGSILRFSETLAVNIPSPKASQTSPFPWQWLLLAVGIAAFIWARRRNSLREKEEARKAIRRLENH